MDITYPRESSLTEELAARAGSSYCTPELAGAFARTVAWVILFDGPESKNVSNTTGGYSADRSLKGKNVFVMRGGQVIKDAPYVLPDATIKEAVSQMSRGNNAMGVRFADAATRKEIEKLNDSKWAGGQGHALALALCHTVRV